MDSLRGRKWHHLEAGQAIELLDSNAERGLDRFEIDRRRARFGPNVISGKKERGPLIRFILQFHQPLIYILLASGTITAVLGKALDAAVIYGVVLVNAVVGFVQEGKAVKAMAALSRSMTATATVIRAGEREDIPAEDLAPGDIVWLKSGDKVPADLRLFQARDLKIDESALTGESLPVEKSTEPTPEDAALGDRTGMAYASTLVSYGVGKGVVVATGDETEIGRISGLIAAAEDLKTPLTRKIADFSRLLMLIIVGLGALTFGVGLWRGFSLSEMFMAGIALAVGAIPEGMPAAVTVILAMGVSRMAKRRAIIRKLPAVETLGSTTVICTDKTGTLTENQMTVTAIYAGGGHYAVTGVGYAPKGEIRSADGKDDAGNAALEETLKAGLLCNDSEIEPEDGRWRVEGDPTEGALIVSAGKRGYGRDFLATHPRLDAIPFESENQFMATLHALPDGAGTAAYLKGAVGRVLKRCDHALDQAGRNAPLDAQAAAEEAGRLARQGMRVLAFARGEFPKGGTDLKLEDIQGGLTFLGLQGMIDPPRSEAAAAVADCKKAGIAVKMITGDHALTALAIARQVGLVDMPEHDSGGRDVLTGREIEVQTDDELIGTVRRIHVYARVSPEQKLRLVEALQANGHVAAMTGDGVNDAPALKQADIGVAMGLAGTEVAKEAADMVLTDDNFATIRHAVEEGRCVFDNLMKFLTWALPTNIGEGLVILAAIFIGLDLPILPLQILWINMTTAGFLGLMLAFEPREPGLMERPPRDPVSPILTSAMRLRILLVSILMTLAAFGLFRWELGVGGTVDQARTVAVNVFVLMSVFYLFNCRSLTRTAIGVGFFGNGWVILGAVFSMVVQAMFTYLPVMNRLFQSAPIDGEAWLRIVGAAAASHILVEIEKKVQARFGPATG